jgi:hypothetical protein
MSFRLLVEKSVPEEEFEYILEEKDRHSPSTLYIRGPYMVANEKNRNNRKYPIEEMQREVERYTREMINPKRAMGELNHPTTADVDLERACHLVTELTQNGNTWIGKSKVLSTPCGLIVKSLINDGVKMGMSTRSLGQLVNEGNCNIVKDMRLVAVDCVADPSAGNAFVSGILESKQWVLKENGKFEEYYDRFEEAIESLPRHNVDLYLREQILKFINSVGLV